MTSISKKYINKLEDIVNEYNITYHITIKVKPIDAKNNAYIDSEVNDKDYKFQVGDQVRVSKYKNVFAEGHTSNWYEEIFLIKKVKSTVTWAYVINDLIVEEIVGTFYEKELQRQVNKNLGQKK